MQQKNIFDSLYTELGSSVIPLNNSLESKAQKKTIRISCMVWLAITIILCVVLKYYFHEGFAIVQSTILGFVIAFIIWMILVQVAYSKRVDIVQSEAAPIINKWVANDFSTLFVDVTTKWLQKKFDSTLPVHSLTTGHSQLNMQNSFGMSQILTSKLTLHNPMQCVFKSPIMVSHEKHTIWIKGFAVSKSTHDSWIITISYDEANNDVYTTNNIISLMLS